MQQEQTQPPVLPAQVPANPVSSSPDRPAVPTSSTAKEYGGFWVRFAAILIDGFIVWSVYLIIYLVLIPLLGLGATSTISDPYQDPLQTQALMILWVVQMVIYVVYFVFMDVKYGQTLGKKALGLRVTDDSGGNISIGKALLRETIGRWVSGLVFGFGYIWLAFDDKKQGWHDKIAGTYVVKK